MTTLLLKASDLKEREKTVPYTSTNGYMFSLLNKEAELGIRLPKDVAETFMDQYQTT